MKNDNDNLMMKVVGNDVFVRYRNRAGRWGRPVVNNYGVFYKSMIAAAKAAKVTVAKMQHIVDKKKTHKGKRYHYASVEETRAHGAKEHALLSPPSSPKVFKLVANAPVAVPVKTAPVKTEWPNANIPFVGVEWPDGSVSVRLTNDSQWQMMRDSRDALPVEIRAHTRWL